MSVLDSATRNAHLYALGFRGSTKTRITNFQRSWNLGTWLTVDGLYGPATDAALRRSHANQQASKPTASAHFSFSEFACKCNGKYATCQGVWINRVHVKRLESLRAKIGTVRVNSGCRCPGHNAAVGGATSSQHMYGVATDIAGVTKTATMKGYRLFAGIGYSLSAGTVLHVDSRDIGGHNLTNGTLTTPTVWRYA